MGAYELWVNMNMWGQTHRQTDRQTHRHINTMTRPGIVAGPIEKSEKSVLKNSTGETASLVWELH